MLTGKDIIKEGHPTLYKKASEVSLPLNQEDKATLISMGEYLVNSINPELSTKYNLRPGVGLAAPQINVSKRMIAINTYDETGQKPYVLHLVNPKIVSESVLKTYIPGGEGCLSVDRETEGMTLRSHKIRLKGYNYDPKIDQLKSIDMTLKGYISVVVQHEIDHLNGILFVDKLTFDVERAKPIIFPKEEKQAN
jgi:peptide deformylase